MKVINGVNVTGLMQTIDAVKADATVAKFRFRVHNEWLEGGHNRSTLNEIYGAGQLHHRAKSFEIHADEPIVLLGSDTAPNPSEYLLTALAACVTSSLVYHAAARGIKIEEVESQVEGDVDVRGFLGLDPSVRNGFDNIRMTLASTPMSPTNNSRSSPASAQDSRPSLTMSQTECRSQFGRNG